MKPVFFKEGVALLNYPEKGNITTFDLQVNEKLAGIGHFLAESCSIEGWERCEEHEWVNQIPTVSSEIIFELITGGEKTFDEGFPIVPFKDWQKTGKDYPAIYLGEKVKFSFEWNDDGEFEITWPSGNVFNGTFCD